MMDAVGCFGLGCEKSMHAPLSSLCWKGCFSGPQGCSQYPPACSEPGVVLFATPWRVEGGWLRLPCAEAARGPRSSKQITERAIVMAPCTRGWRAAGQADIYVIRCMHSRQERVLQKQRTLHAGTPPGNLTAEALRK